MPRPGIEPGLEVPETSVMSFSLPGHAGEANDRTTSAMRGGQPYAPRRSIKNRGQVRIFRFVVQADGHQGHLLHQAESLAETPAEQIAVARGNQEAGAQKSRRCRNQRLQRLVRFSDRVAAV